MPGIPAHTGRVMPRLLILVILAMAATASGFDMLSTSRPTVAETSEARDLPPPAAATIPALVMRRIFFGHQSVGADLLNGLVRVVRESGVPLRISEWSTPDALDSPGLVHTLIGRNEDPDSKIRHFE